MLSEIFLFCSLSLLSGLFSYLCCYCPVMLNLDPTPSSFLQSSVNFTAMAQIALAPINPSHVSVLALSLRI